MRDTHAGMNISEQEFVAVVDDIVAAMEKVGVGPEERNEVIAILFSLKGDIIRI
jgi:hemoglobin